MPTNTTKQSKKSKKKDGKSKKKQTEVIEETSNVIYSDQDNENENSFYSVALSFKNDISVTLAIEEWIETFDIDNTKPMSELINFILQSCGCHGRVKPNVFEERDDIEEVLSELQNNYKTAEISEYPIISKQKIFTGTGYNRNTNTFIGNLEKFWILWCKEMKYKIINEEENWIFDNLKVWIISMSSSNFRPFRHTSTLIGLSLGIELCNIANSIQSELTISERQLSKEQSKKSRSRSRSQRESQLEKKIEELQNKKEKINTHIDDFFVGLFIHRYRDICDEIRYECANKLRIWIMNYPIYFLNDNYTRYIGWFLSDKAYIVRLVALQGFQTILSLGEEWISMFMSFIERFKSRIFEMAKREINKKVQQSTLLILSEIGKLGLLDEEDYDDIIPLLFLDGYKGKYQDIYSKMLENMLNSNDEDSEEENTNESENENIKEWKKLKKIIKMLVKYGRKTGNELTECRNIINFDTKGDSLIKKEVSQWFNNSLKNRINNFSYESFESAITTLWGILDIVKNYNTIYKYIICDKSENYIQEEDLDLNEEEELCLVWLFKISVLNSFETIKDQAASNKKNDEEQSELIDINRDIMKIIPKLLTRLSNDFDGRKLDSLLDIVMKINLGLYLDLRVQKSFDDLFESLNTVYTKSKNQNVLSKCSIVYSTLIGDTSKNENNSTEDQNDTYDNSSIIGVNQIGKKNFSKIVNEIISKQILSSLETINNNESENLLLDKDQSCIESLNYGLIRIMNLLKQIDLETLKDLIQDCNSIFTQTITKVEELLIKVNQLKKKSNNINKNEDSMEIDNEDEEKNKERLSEVSELLQEILNNCNTGLFIELNWSGIKLERMRKDNEENKNENENGDSTTEANDKVKIKNEEEDEINKISDIDNNKENNNMDISNGNDNEENKKKNNSNDNENNNVIPKDLSITSENNTTKDSTNNGNGIEIISIKKSELEIEQEKIIEKVEKLLKNNQKIINKANKKFWNWNTRYTAYHILCDTYLLCNNQLSNILKNNKIKIPTLSIQKEMVKVLNECLEIVYLTLLNENQEDFLDKDFLERKDYSKLVTYSIIGYQISILITPLQKLIISGVISLENSSSILQWIEFLSYRKDKDSDENNENSNNDDIQIINSYWINQSQKLIDEILSRYPKLLIENETKKAADLTKDTNKHDSEEVSQTTKAATAIILNVRSVLEKILEEFAKPSIEKSFDLYLNNSNDDNGVLSTKLIRMISNAIKSWSTVSTSSALRKIILQTLVIFLRKCGQMYFDKLPKNIKEMDIDDREAAGAKNNSFWTALSYIAKVLSYFITNNDEKKLYMELVEKNLISEIEQKFEEINLIPNNDNNALIWTNYYEYISILRSGKIVKRKTTSVSSNRKKKNIKKKVSTKPVVVIENSPTIRRVINKNGRKGSIKSKQTISDDESEGSSDNEELTDVSDIELTDTEDENEDEIEESSSNSEDEIEKIRLEGLESSSDNDEEEEENLKSRSKKVANKKSAKSNNKRPRDNSKKSNQNRKRQKK